MTCDLSAAENAAVQVISPPLGSDLYSEINAAAKAGAGAAKRLRVLLSEGEYKMSCDVGGPLLDGDSTKSVVWLEIRGPDRKKATIKSTGACPTAMPHRRLLVANNGTCVKLQGLTLDGGSADQYLVADYPALENDMNWGGAVLFLDDSAGVLSDVEITNSKANDGGGIFFVDSVNVTISDSVISANTATGSSGNGGSGGGLALYGQDWKYPTMHAPFVSLHRVELIGNRAKTYGGGLYSQYSYLNTDDLIFRENYAAQKGGGMCIYPMGYPHVLAPAKPAFIGPQLFSNMLFEDNKAGGRRILLQSPPPSHPPPPPPLAPFPQPPHALGGGGGVSFITLDKVGAATSILQNVTIRSNSAPTGGGFLGVNQLKQEDSLGLNPFTVLIKDSLIESNHATKKTVSDAGSSPNTLCLICMSFSYLYVLLGFRVAEFSQCVEHMLLRIQQFETIPQRSQAAASLSRQTKTLTLSTVQQPPSWIQSSPKIRSGSFLITLATQTEEGGYPSNHLRLAIL
jgi:hypothetical protein